MMNKKLLRYITLFGVSSILIMTLTQCKENEMMDFSLDGSIYFYETDTLNAVERIVTEENYSFALVNSSLMEDTIKVRVKLMGAVADYDRTFKAVAIADSSTAIEGVHYKLLDGVMKAGEYISYLPVVLYRTADTKEQKVSVYLRISQTNDLGAGNANLINYRISWADMLMKPKNWPYYFGSYSNNKYRFAIDVLGMTEWPQADRFYDGVSGGVFTISELQLFANQLNEAYTEYRKTHDPIYMDENADELVEIYYSPES